MLYFFKSKINFWETSFLILIFLIVAVTFFLLVSKNFSTTIDDAYITFQYSKNLIRGDGLSYNPGIKIEGTSSLFWTLLLALFSLFNLPIIFTAKIISLFVVVVIIPFLFYKFFKNKYLTISSVILLWTNASFILWGTLGLESVFYSALILGFFIFIDQLRRLSIKNIYFLLLIGSVIILTRPEGFLYILAAYLYLFFIKKENKNRMFYLGLGWLIFLAALTIFRLFYFNSLLPNTFWAKSFGILFSDKIIGGCYYIKKWLWDFPWLAILFCLGLLKNIKSKTTLLAIFFVIVQGIFVITSADSDWMLAYRHLIPILPIIIIFSSLGLSEMVIFLEKFYTTKRISNLLLLLFVLFIALFQICIFYSYPQFSVWRESYCDREGGVALGKWINKNTVPGVKIAARDIGALGFYSDRYVIDLVGLTDEHIGKTSGYYSRQLLDVDYVFNQNPEYIIINDAHYNISQFDPDDLTKKIYDDGRFAQYHYLETFTCYPGYYYHLFIRM